jgi:Protein of unknown function (DUF2950)
MNIRLATLTAVMLITGPLALAEAPSQTTFPSAEAASRALFMAVKNHDEAAIVQILGAPRTEEERRDEERLEHEQFARKYEEMHRLARERKGQMMLYIGAENWPFPVPLVSQNNTWRFDFAAGEKEIMFRRIGENELTAIEVCRSLATAAQNPQAHEDDELLGKLLADSGSDTTPTLFHGYHFRVLNRHGSDFTVVAYPSVYRSSGVMTFIAGQHATVYAKDLGTNTTELAKGIKGYHPDKSWRKEAVPTP